MTPEIHLGQGIFLEGATYGDMCPLEVPDGRFDDDINYPGCLLESPSDGGNKNSAGDDVKSSDDGMSTVTLVGIIGRSSGIDLH